VASGTGFLTRHLPGRVIAVDQSRAMLNIARSRLLQGAVAQADLFCLALPVGRLRLSNSRPLRPSPRTEAGAISRCGPPRGGGPLIIGTALREGVAPEQQQQRLLNDGSRHTVYKRYFTPEQLAAELGSGVVLYGGQWFVAVMA
jgi:demethylmenaquinone methyltransferase/2-methoxy-6-polyprenyl-1,4-benzoquinol methylase